MNGSVLATRSIIKSEPLFRNQRKPKKSLSYQLQNVYTLEEIKAEVRWWKQLQNYLRGKPANPENYFNRLCGLCLSFPREQKLLYKFRKTGLARMNKFLTNSTRKEAQEKSVKLLTWSCLSLLSFYYSKHQNQVEKCNCFRLRKLEQSKTILRNAMYMILPEKQIEVIRFTIKYMTLSEQWNTEDYDSFVFQELLTMITKPELLVAKVIKQIEHSQKDEQIVEAFNISCTLLNILEHAYWDKYLFNNLLHNCFNTLLKMYLLCNFSKESKVESVRLRGTIKSSTKYFISNIKDNKGLVSVMDSIAKCLSDSTIVKEDRNEITEMIIFCAQRHFTKYYRESITPDLLNLLLSNFLADDKTLAVMSHKIFHHLLDRHGNIKFFTEPIYYFKGRSDFTVNHEYGMEDIHFFKSFSKKFFEGIHQSFLGFTEKYEVVAIYTTLCLILVEIPEPVITINAIHVIITTQNDLIKSKANFSMTKKAHIHAIVSAVMSLICVIHQDDVASLKRYAEEVVRFRIENSPHLLPPLQNKYTVANHHTTEYHDQLYFLEEEVLYALQSCWLGKRVGSSSK